MLLKPVAERTAPFEAFLGSNPSCVSRRLWAAGCSAAPTSSENARRRNRSKVGGRCAAGSGFPILREIYSCRHTCFSTISFSPASIALPIPRRASLPKKSLPTLKKAPPEEAGVRARQARLYLWLAFHSFWHDSCSSDNYDFLHDQKMEQRLAGGGLTESLPPGRNKSHARHGCNPL